jgi:hypothetical protein
MYNKSSSGDATIHPVGAARGKHFAGTAATIIMIHENK